MVYGSSIGTKFYEDGRVRAFPGNTVVAPITPENPAYAVAVQLRDMVKAFGLEDYYTMLPADSYHMTVIDGLVDQIRTDDHWPANLRKDAPMEQVDDYVTDAFVRAGIPQPAQMRFDEIHVSKNCMIIHLLPANEAQERILRDFRDRAAEEEGVKFNGHDTYRFHISLAYTRVVPEGEAADRLEQMKAAMNAILAQQPPFMTGTPYMAYFNDMYAFSPNRIPRIGTSY